MSARRRARPPMSVRLAATAGLIAALATATVPAQQPPGPPELLPAGNPASVAFVGPPLMPKFAILGEEVLPGGLARLEWRTSQGFAGDAVLSPVVVAHGLRPGPVLCLTAAIHGDEINGVEVVRRVVNEIEPSQLSGTLIAVPIVNLFGFSRGSRYLPDRRDLNRFFPGNRVGSIASRIAHNFLHNVITHCDALVDFHTGSFDRSNLPQVRADLRSTAVMDFVRRFGGTPVLHSAGSRGMLRVAAAQMGIPAVTFEIGGPSVLQLPEIERSVEAIQSLMYELGMIATAAARSEPSSMFYSSQWVRVDSGGMLLGRVALGERVVAGQTLGMVIDPINNIEREVLATVSGRVIGMARNQVVLPGFAAYHIGEEQSAAAAARSAVSGDNPGALEEEYADPSDPDAIEPDPPADEFEPPPS